VFAATDAVTAPLPIPLPTDAMVIHESRDAGVHVHVGDDAATWMVTLPPVAETVCRSGERLSEHDAEVGLAWLTVKFSPAIDTVPLRADPALPATAKRTVPFPVALPPLRIEIHST
jgi:hypothetical protein